MDRRTGENIAFRHACAVRCRAAPEKTQPLDRDRVKTGCAMSGMQSARPART